MEQHLQPNQETQEINQLQASENKTSSNSRRRRVFILLLFFIFVLICILTLVILIKNPRPSFFSSNKKNENKPSQITPTIQENRIAIPSDLRGDYFAQVIPNSSKERSQSFRISQVNDIDKISPVVDIGKDGEYVSQLILAKKRHIILANLEKKIILLDLSNGKFKDIYFVPKDMMSINDMVLSPDEKTLIFDINGVNKYKLISMNLDDYSIKEFSQDTLSKYAENAAYLMPRFWHGNDEVFIAQAQEGKLELIRLNILSGVIKISSINGSHSPDGSKLIESDELPPYGGCYLPKDFNLYWYDTKTEKKSIIVKSHNTEFGYWWNSQGSEVLISSREYVPKSSSQCPDADFKNAEYFIYSFADGKIKKVSSATEQINQWYPKTKTYFDRKGLDMKKDRDYVIYLGSID